MRMNTLENQGVNFRKGFSFTDNLNQKSSLPNIFPSPNKNKLSKSNLRVLTLHKNKNKNKKISIQIKSPITHRNTYRAKQNLKMVSLLTFDDKVNDILKSESEMKKLKEKIDNNKMIKLLRLGLYKKKKMMKMIM